ncbi:uncharacterized protein LOC135400170 [Ornithodoros turicata]|uniref:uncharacterized protein LOC135400170 n=1 Tax=Ornithodoros turicata TaxID=34597 RepID=UPI00313A347A
MPSKKDEAQDSVGYILGKFDELYSPYKNVTHGAAIFNMMKQREGQTIDEYVMELQLQAQKCDFGEKASRVIGDRIILGIRDSALRERLFRESNLTLEKTIQFCTAAEISKRHLQDIENTRKNDIPLSVDVLRQQQGPSPTGIQSVRHTFATIFSCYAAILSSFKVSLQPAAKRQPTGDTLFTLWTSAPTATVPCICNTLSLVWNIWTFRTDVPKDRTFGVKPSSGCCTALRHRRDSGEQRTAFGSTPISGRKSPAELLMGRRLRTLVPTLSCNLSPRFDCQGTRKVLQQRQWRQHIHGDLKTKPLRPVTQGQDVWFRHNNKCCSGTVACAGPGTRSYIMKSQDGSWYRRNRFHIKPAFRSTANDYNLGDDTSNEQVEDEQRAVHEEPASVVHTDTELCRDETRSQGGYVTRSGRLSVPPARYQSAF